MTIYHVAPEGHTGDLQSLYTQERDDAYELYAARWPEAGELAQYHVHYVHCFDDLERAREHAAAFGGKIYAIDTADIDVERDTLEFDHPVVRDIIDADCIRAVS